MKAITSKRNKTDADFEELARLEFLGSLYMVEGGPVIPANCIEGTLVNAAKKKREGVTAKSGMFCDAHARLEYTGPRLADELWGDEEFRIVSPVKVGTAKVMRTRPFFRNWSTVITVTFDDEQTNLSSVDEWVKLGGQVVGLLDWRPKYGRYETERVS